MGRRDIRRPALPDWHLWTEVTRTIEPLPGRAVPDAEPAPESQLKPAEPGPHRHAAGRPIFMQPGSQPRRLGSGPTMGIEPQLRRKLMRGRVEIDATLDLHGMRQSEAHAALGRFITARHARGDRTILVITGKGLKKVEGDARRIVEMGVLRSMLPRWLSEPHLAPLVSAWSQAAQAHGGEGAVYVRLRRTP